MPGVKKPLGQYGPSGVEDNTAADSKDDDDDMDLFGSDDEVTASCLEFNSTLLILSGLAVSNDLRCQTQSYPRWPQMFYDNDYLVCQLAEDSIYCAPLIFLYLWNLTWLAVGNPSQA